MADVFIVFWRDIPAQVLVRAGRHTARRQLSERFEQAIDRAAMRAGLSDTDGYLGEWRRVRAGACPDQELEAAAERRAQALEQAYPDERLRALVGHGGLAAAAEGSGSS